MPPTRQQVISKVKYYWPDIHPEQVMDILDQYGIGKFEQERARVQLAVLKLSEGRFERLPDLVKAAKGDFRDVLAWAEYPGEFKLGFVKMKQLSIEEAKAIRRRDRQQYIEWLDEN
jgi:hypothetical protein